jgi:hypothetical protein
MSNPPPAHLRAAIEHRTAGIEGGAVGAAGQASPEEVAQLEAQMKLLGYM